MFDRLTLRRPFRLALFLVALTSAASAADAQLARKMRTAAVAAQSQPPFYASRDEALRFADDVAERRGLEREWVRQAIGQAQMLPTVVRLMRPPARGVAKNWRVYRSRFIDAARIQAGVRFWREHGQALARAESEFGVPAQIIVGILGVETIYGRNMGDFKVMDALTTLAFDFPPEHPRAAARQAFFRDELEQFLTLCQRTGQDPHAPLGSYAGAMGMPQFMPSSWLQYAVDFDGDGHVDLTNPVDAIGSVAHYFKGYRWQPGLPTHYPVHFDAATLDLDGLLAPDILPSFSPANFAAKGALIDGTAAAAHSGALALIELQNGTEAPSYVAGTDNFYAITRYNQSSYYAMAVIELGQAVALALDR